MSRMTVIRTIDNLVNLDLIKVQKRKTDKNDYSSNLYFIKNINAEEGTSNNLEEVVTEDHHHSDIKSPKGQRTEGKLYCDKRGVITLETSNGMRRDKRCTHKLDFIKGSDVVRITSAKPGYQIPKFEHQVLILILMTIHLKILIVSVMMKMIYRFK